MMNDDVLNSLAGHREMVCALADGQLRGLDFAKVVESIHSDANSRAAWQAYHIVGDVLRSPELAEYAGDVNFLARFRSRLVADGDAQAAYKTASSASVASDLRLLSARNQTSANEAVFAWKLTAGFASLAAVIAIGWSLATGSGLPVGGALLAQAVPAAQTTSNAVTGAESSAMIRDPNLDALMAAHKQFGGTTALQMPSGFLRNATFEGAAR